VREEAQEEQGKAEAVCRLKVSSRVVHVVTGGEELRGQAACADGGSRLEQGRGGRAMGG
jgi:hypothetical protein